MGPERGIRERFGVETSSALPFSLFIYRHPTPDPDRRAPSFTSLPNGSPVSMCCAPAERLRETYG